MKKENGTKLEFLLTLNENIIIQRYFYVNNFNYKSKNSLDLYECINYIVFNIESDLQKKSFNYSYEDQNYFHNMDDVSFEDENKNEHFLLKIKYNDEVFIQRIFLAYVYHPKARYSVDIRSQIKEILNHLTEILSMDQYTTNYLNYSLETR